MKFALADSTDGYLIRAYSEKELVIGERRFNRSLVLLPDRIIPDWRPDSFQQLTAEDFESLVELHPDLVLLGTGQYQAFPPPALYRSLVNSGIGLEIMTTPAACRTYNILVAEGRRVTAALILD